MYLIPSNYSLRHTARLTMNFRELFFERLGKANQVSLRVTIEKQKKKIEELEKRPILTDEMIADLVTLRKRKEGEARRNAKYKRKHSSVK